MNNSILVSPSILSADFGKLGNEVFAAEMAGADWIHIDVMDGVFVPNITIGQCVVEAVKRNTSLPLDVHLMIVDPMRYAESFIKAGADILTVHYETVKDAVKAVEIIKSFGVKAGVSISPETSAAVLRDVVNVADLILIMTVHPGFSGQKFMEECCSKISEVKAMAKGRDIIIQVDGGINPDTAKIAKAHGANCLVAGSAVFGSKDYAAAILNIRR